MQTTRTTLLPASPTLNRRVITPRKTPTDGKTRNSAAKTAIISECDPLRRHEPGDEEVRIAKEAKDLLIGMAIIVAVCVISDVVTKVYFYAYAR